MDKLSYGTTEVDFDALPAASQRALAQRGLTHVLGNEVASKVHAWAQGEGQANSKDRAEVAAWKEANAAAIDAKTSEYVVDALAALTAGTLGDRVGGPRLTPIETIKRRIAKVDIETILRTNKLKVPKGDETVTMKGEEFTMAQLIDRRLAHDVLGPEIVKKAEKELAAQKKAQDAIKAGAEEALNAL